MLAARDVMNTNVVTIRTDNTVEEAVKAVLDEQVSGLPVVDEQRRVLGIISEYALLGIAYDLDIVSDPVTVYMTKSVIWVEEDTPINEVADLFILHRIRRLPVTRDGRLIGLISRRDLLRKVREANLAFHRPASQASVGAAD